MNGKKMLCLVISGLIMIGGTSIGSFAETYDAAKNITVGASAETFDLSESDFNDYEQESVRGLIHAMYDETVLSRSLIEIGNEMQAFIYDEGKVSDYNVDYYPVYINGQIDSVFSISNPGEHACCSLNQNFSSELRKFLDKEGNGILIWAGNRLFAKNGKTVSIVWDLSAVLDLETYTEEDIANLAVPQPKEAREKFLVSGTRNMGEKRLISDIYFVPQPNESTCWAATMACIIHNQTKTKYTVPQVINKVGTNPPEGVSTDDMTDLLFSKYNIKGTFVYECPTDLTVRAEIDSNVAFIAGWEEINGKRGHATVICGYDDTGRLMRISFMDPAGGILNYSDAIKYMDYRLDYGSIHYKLTNHTRFPVK